MGEVRIKPKKWLINSFGQLLVGLLDACQENRVLNYFRLSPTGASAPGVSEFSYEPECRPSHWKARIDGADVPNRNALHIIKIGLNIIQNGPLILRFRLRPPPKVNPTVPKSRGSFASTAI